MGGNELNSLINEHIELLAEARRERNHWKQSSTDYFRALREQQDVNAALKARVEELEGALDHLIQDAENHNDGDDRAMTLDITIRRARKALATTPAKEEET